MSEMSISLQTAPAAAHEVVWEENACISHAVIHSFICLRGCSTGHNVLPAPPASILQVPVLRLVMMCGDEMTERWGPPLQCAGQVLEKAEEKYMSPRWNYFQSINPIFHSSSAVNVSVIKERFNCFLSYLIYLLSFYSAPAVWLALNHNISIFSSQFKSFRVLFFFCLLFSSEIIAEAHWTLTCYFKPVGNLTSDHFPS